MVLDLESMSDTEFTRAFPAGLCKTRDMKCLEIVTDEAGRTWIAIQINMPKMIHPHVAKMRHDNGSVLLAIQRSWYNEILRYDQGDLQVLRPEQARSYTTLKFEYEIVGPGEIVIVDLPFHPVEFAFYDDPSAMPIPGNA